MELLGTPLVLTLVAVRAMFQMEASQDTTNLSTWAGSPATLDDFAEEVDLHALGTKLDTRETCGPRITRAHAPGTPQKKLAMGLGMTVLTVPDGGQKVVAKFREPPQRTTGS